MFYLLYLVFHIKNKWEIQLVDALSLPLNYLGDYLTQQLQYRKHFSTFQEVRVVGISQVKNLIIIL